MASINGGETGKKPRDTAQTASLCIATGAAIIHSHIDWTNVSGEAAAARYMEGWVPVPEWVPEAPFFPTINWGPGGTRNHDHVLPLMRSGGRRLGVHDIGAVRMGYLEDGIPGSATGFASSFNAARRRLSAYVPTGVPKHDTSLHPTDSARILWW